MRSLLNPSKLSVGLSRAVPRILVAPDKFKGSLDATSVAKAIADGIRSVRPGVTVVELPMADGGEGTLAAALSAGYLEIRCRVSGPHGQPIEAAYAMRDRTALIELAQASGARPDTRNRPSPLTASTFGAGQLILDALQRGANLVILGLGGSVTTDGGAGLLVALGGRLLDSDGIRLRGRGGGDLINIASLDTTLIKYRIANTRFVVAYDVSNPLLGEHGTATVFGPQKGATSQEVATLNSALARYADVVCHATGTDMREAPGAGAAGGVGFAALSVLNATAISGASAVMDLVGFDSLAKDSDLIISGEGNLDAQSLAGKVPVAVANRAARFGHATVVVAGGVDLAEDELRAANFQRVYALRDYEPDLSNSMRLVGTLLRRVGREIAHRELVSTKDRPDDFRHV